MNSWSIVKWEFGGGRIFPDLRQPTNFSEEKKTFFMGQTWKSVNRMMSKKVSFPLPFFAEMWNLIKRQKVSLLFFAESCWRFFFRFFCKFEFSLSCLDTFFAKKTPGAAKRCIFLSGLKSLWRCCDNFWWPITVNI